MGLPRGLKPLLESALPACAGLNAFFGILLILSELRFEFYHFYSPATMAPTLISAEADFYAWLVLAFPILLALLLLGRAVPRKALFALALLEAALLPLPFAGFKKSFLALTLFGVSFAALTPLGRRRGPSRVLSLFASPPLALLASIEASSIAFALMGLRGFYPFSAGLERRIAGLSVQLFYALYPLTLPLLLALLSFWAWAPLASPLLRRARFNPPASSRLAAPTLLASMASAALLAHLPYLVRAGFVGVDARWYLEALSRVEGPGGVLALVKREPRGVYLALLWAMTLLGLSKEAAVKLGPAALTALHALSAFLLLNSVTENKLLSALSSFFAGLSFPATVGMYAGIYANWLSLSMAFMAAAALINSVKKASKPSLGLAVAFSFLSLASHAWTGGVILAAFAVYGFLALLSLARKKLAVGEEAREVWHALTLVAAAVALVALTLALIGPSGLAAALQSGGQLLRSTSPLNAFSFLESLRFALKFYVGGFFAAPNFLLLALLAAPILSARRPPLRLFRAWLLVGAFLLLVSGEWLKWRILYVMPFQALSGLGFAFLIGSLRGEGAPSKLLMAALTSAILLQSFNYALRCALFIPEY